MHFIFSISAALFATSLVQSAPTGTALDAATLLANGQDAQKLNSQFLNGNISTSDSCKGDETACINNAIATCVDGRFDVSQGRCSKSQSCFALPNVKKAGTNLVCTSEKSALSLIEATGAKGGITGSDSSSGQNTTSSRASTTAASDDEGMEMGCTDTSVPTASPTVDRVTVTVTLTPTQTVTLAPVTTTITPEEASSVLSSILAQGTATLDDSSSSSSVILTTPSATADITDLASAAPTTILLTVGRDTSETAVPSSSILASAAAAVTSSVDSSASDGGYYGGY